MVWDMLLGGVTGLIGTIWSGYNQRKLKELELKDRAAGRTHEIALVQAESEAMRAEAEANIRVTEAQVAGAVQLEETRAYTVSQKVGNKSIFDAEFMDRLFETKGKARLVAIPVGTLICMAFGIADFVKSMARPTITAYLLAVSTWVTWKAWTVLEGLGEPLSPGEAALLVKQSVSVVLYLATAAVTWWFGDRMAAKGAAKILGTNGTSKGR